MNESMNAWLRSYEKTRTEGLAGMSANGLLSSRFNLENLSWDEIRDIPIEELGPEMTFGKQGLRTAHQDLAAPET